MKVIAGPPATRASLMLCAALITCTIAGCRADTTGTGARASDTSSPVAQQTSTTAAASHCVDENIADMGPNEMLALMRAGIRQLGGSWAQSADLLDSMTYPDDQWPWGPQPKHALADYVRGVCDYLPAVYPADTVERIRTISGVLFMDPLTTCTTWRIGGAETARTRKTDLAAITDPAQRAIAEITLKYFCPQLG